MGEPSGSFLLQRGVVELEKLERFVAATVGGFLISTFEFVYGDSPTVIIAMAALVSFIEMVGLGGFFFLFKYPSCF